MDTPNNGAELVREFLALYAESGHKPLVLAEFEADDLYAFQAFERAQITGPDELRQMAQQLREQRRLRMESGAAADKLQTTYKMPNLAGTQAGAPAEDDIMAALQAAADEATTTIAKESVADAVAGHPPQDDARSIAAEAHALLAAAAAEAMLARAAPAAAARAKASHAPAEQAPDPGLEAAIAAAAAAAISGEPAAPAPALGGRSGADTRAPDGPAAVAPPAPAQTTPAYVERRAGAVRLGAQELDVVTDLRRLYREQFQLPLDVARFVLDDLYGRAVIAQSRASDNPELAALAGHYLDEGGWPLAHRRNPGRALRAAYQGPTADDTRNLTLICDGTTQTLGDFHGIGTYCIVANCKESGTIAAAVKGIRQALLAPGHAIACRTPLIRVKGPAGSTVSLEFVGLADLAQPPNEKPVSS